MKLDPHGVAFCDTDPVTGVDLLDLAEIRGACERFGVARLRVVGSAVTELFDPSSSDDDFLADFEPG
jgi:uncharacterized protein